MKTKIGLVVLAVLSVGLAIALVSAKKQAAAQQEKDGNAILDFSNQVTKASINLDELRQVNLTLNNDLSTNRVLLADLSNNLAAVSETVTNVKNSLQAAQDQIATQSGRITDLQAQNKLLDDRATELTAQAVALTNTIVSLNSQINDTLRQLADSQTNNVLLEKQLQQLVAMKAELEHKFNTLEAVREQVRKLRDEMIAARRLQWMKAGTDVQLKGAELMMQQRNASTNSASARGANFGLNVEVGSDGSIRALPPSGTATNSSATNPPAQ